MILTGNEICKEVKKGKIIIEPFDKRNITTNTYDLALGSEYLVYLEKVLDPRKNNRYEIKKIPNKGHKMNKGDFILGHSHETIGSKHYVPIIHARSGIARLGLFVHITSDLIDIGSIGNITFQLYATRSIVLYPGMKIGQVSFWVPKGKIELYDGKYQGSKGPRPSEVHKDFELKTLKYPHIKKSLKYKNGNEK